MFLMNASAGGVWALGSGGARGADHRGHDAAEAGRRRLRAVLLRVRRDQRRGGFICKTQHYICKLGRYNELSPHFSKQESRFTYCVKMRCTA